MFREPLPSGLAIPFFEGIRGYLAFDEQLSELAPLRLALERHHVLRSMGQASLLVAIISRAQRNRKALERDLARAIDDAGLEPACGVLNELVPRAIGVAISEQSGRLFSA